MKRHTEPDASEEDGQGKSSAAILNLGFFMDHGASGVPGRAALCQFCSPF